MDTTLIACTAEDLISYKLQHSGLLVAKPKFDRDGADLLVFMEVGEGTKFCRVQCKGRSLLKSNSSNVEVFKSYVTNAFILFLFVDDGNENKLNLLCFFSDEIKKNWRLKTYKDSSKDFYRLSFSKSVFTNVEKKGNLIDYALNEHKIERIKDVIKQSDTRYELKQLFDLIKMQNELVKLQKKKNELEALINEIKHTEEKIKLKKDHQEDLETILEAENNKIND
jgi:cell fate (sporulation/competence/biofilm development) regulator YlbF (YheA/YmcA/DUF963 family)